MPPCLPPFQATVHTTPSPHDPDPPWLSSDAALPAPLPGCRALPTPLPGCRALPVPRAPSTPEAQRMNGDER